MQTGTTTTASQAPQLMKVDGGQITRLTWQGKTQPNYGGNTFKARAQVTADHVIGGIAKLSDYECYTFNGHVDITAEFYAEVTRIIEVKAKARIITEIIKGIADVLKEGPTPAGHLYAALMATGISLEMFDKIIDSFISAGKVRKANHMLYWID